MKLVKIVNFLNLGMDHNRIISKKDPDVIASKIYFSDDLRVYTDPSKQGSNMSYFVSRKFLLVWKQVNKTNNPTRETLVL